VLLLLVALEWHLQVTTVLPGVALLYLTYNMAKPWAIRWAQEKTASETGCVKARFSGGGQQGCMHVLLGRDRHTQAILLSVCLLP